MLTESAVLFSLRKTVMYFRSAEINANEVKNWQGPVALSPIRRQGAPTSSHFTGVPPPAGHACLLHFLLREPDHHEQLRAGQDLRPPMDPYFENAQAAPKAGANDKLLFWACFMSIVATAFGFIIRTQIIDDWGTQFRLSETQKGEIFGVGLWPFAISIVLFSLIIDRIGYGKAMIFAFVCHVTSAILTICAPMLAKGDNVLAFPDPLLRHVHRGPGQRDGRGGGQPGRGNALPPREDQVAELPPRRLAGRPRPGRRARLADGRCAVGIQGRPAVLPVVAYGVLMLGRRFPIHERVEAGVSYKEMLQEVGILAP